MHIYAVHAEELEGFLELLTIICLQEGGDEAMEEGGAKGMDKRVTVIETSTGNKLTGEDAPRKEELEQWLQDNPG